GAASQSPPARRPVEKLRVVKPQQKIHFAQNENGGRPKKAPVAPVRPVPESFRAIRLWPSCVNASARCREDRQSPGRDVSNATDVSAGRFRSQQFHRAAAIADRAAQAQSG